MKKIATWLFIFTLFASEWGAVWAAERGTEEYKRLVELKKAQREKKATAKPQGTPQEKNFWQREAERSGFAGTAAMFGNAIGGVIPLDKPNSRKSNS